MSTTRTSRLHGLLPLSLRAALSGCGRSPLRRPQGADSGPGDAPTSRDRPWVQGVVATLSCWNERK